MKVLFAAPESAWGGIYDAIQSALPEHHLEATGGLSIETLKGFDVLIPTVSVVSEQLLEESNGLRLIQQCGSGLDSVDLEAARRKDIWVANVPTWVSGTADSVAELGIYLMIAVSRNVRELARSFADGKLGEPFGRALTGATAGVIGIGGIGRALVKRLKAFDVRVIGIKRSGQQECLRELDMEWVGGPKDLPELLTRSDYIFLCLPLTPETRHIINRTSLSQSKRGSFLINLARGGLVDREALQEALESGLIAGAGLDVFWDEPPNPNDPIFLHNVIATPHAAAATDISRKGVVDVVVENIRRVERGAAPMFHM